jgi:hypothetical protein
MRAGVSRTPHATNLAVLRFENARLNIEETRVK